MTETTASGAAPRPAEPGAGLPTRPVRRPAARVGGRARHPAGQARLPLLGHAGFAEIIPVTPPEAKIAPSSDLKPSALGKCPGQRLPDGTWTGLRTGPS